MPAWRMAPPNIRLMRTARAISTLLPAMTLPTGQPKPLESATDTASKGADSSAAVRPEAAAALNNRAPSR